jgi:hypothetical protein
LAAADLAAADLAAVQGLLGGCAESLYKAPSYIVSRYETIETLARKDFKQDKRSPSSAGGSPVGQKRSPTSRKTPRRTPTDPNIFGLDATTYYPRIVGNPERKAQFPALGDRIRPANPPGLLKAESSLREGPNLF